MRLAIYGLMALAAGMVVDGSVIHDSRQTAPSIPYFRTDWDIEQITLGSESMVHYTLPIGTPFRGGVLPVLMLWQTSATGSSLPTSENTWLVKHFEAAKFELNTCDEAAECLLTFISNSNITTKLYPGTGASSSGLKNFFFCLRTSRNKSSDDIFCQTYSPYFDIETPANKTDQAIQLDNVQVRRAPITASAANPPQATLQAVLTVTRTTSVVDTTSLTVSTSFAATVTSSSTSAPSETAALSTSSPSRGGLAIGAIVGIAVGGFAFIVILLLLCLFCLRRKHRKRDAAPEHAMLTQDHHTDSRDLISEKDTPSNSPLNSGPPVLALNRHSALAPWGTSPSSQTSTPPDTVLTRHSALPPWDDIPSKPYTGSAASIPRRNPAGNPPPTADSTLTREVSAASTVPQPRSAGGASAPSIDLDFEEYHDLPIYGDTRHAPQVFRGDLQAPFLRDSHTTTTTTTTTSDAGTAETVTPEEAARLEEARLEEEEEERRIDAAIAEAERSRNR